MIGCLATEISETFVNRIVRGIEQGLAGGTETLLFVSLVEFSGDYEAAFRFLRSHDIDGLFAGNDYIAAGAINALHEHGIRVPEDVKVVGFDNRDFSSFWKPSITTFQQPLGEMGLVGIGVLRNLIANRSDVEMRDVLESRRIIRESSRRAERGSREVSDSEYQED